MFSLFALTKPSWVPKAGLNWSEAISNCCPEQQPSQLGDLSQTLPRNLPQTQHPRLTWPVIVRPGQCCPWPVWTLELPTFLRVTPLPTLLPPYLESSSRSSASGCVLPILQNLIQVTFPMNLYPTTPTSFHLLVLLTTRVTTTEHLEDSRSS